MPGISTYERLQIESLTGPRGGAPVERGVGLLIMPAGREMEQVHQWAVRPAMQANELSLRDIQLVFDDQSPLADVSHWVQTAEVIVVDLSTLNPSVLYVLGLCHALGRSPLILWQQAHELPFNLAALRNIEYTLERDGLLALRENLKRAIRVFLAAARSSGGG